MHALTSIFQEDVQASVSGDKYRDKTVQAVGETLQYKLTLFGS